MTARRAWAVDGALALGAAAVELVQVFDADRSPPPVAVALAFAAGAVLLWRRREPLLTLGVSLAAVIGVGVAGVSPAGFAPLIALYTVAVARDRRTSLIALAAAVPAGLAAYLVAPTDDRLFDPLAIVACAAAAWGIGVFVQTRREYRRELERGEALLESEREQQARASIARELHDIVAHSVAVMLVGVRGARDVLRSDPDVADATLAKVETSGEQSLAELRRILALLRAGDAESHPQPSLAQLDDLVAEYRHAGLDVTLERSGEPRPLPGGFELSVYRIVQEALTNVLKHADAGNVVVTLAFEDSRLDLEVVDDGSPPEVVVPGHGLVGMRERVALLGGELEAGRRSGGGFRIAARLPV